MKLDRVAEYIISLGLNLFPNVNYNMAGVKQGDVPKPTGSRTTGLASPPERRFAQQLLSTLDGPPPLVDRSVSDVVSAVAPPDPMVGKIVGGYRLLELLGKGGMGAVYLAEVSDNPTAPQVAVKILPIDPLADDYQKRRDRFFAEAAAIFKLHHQNIVQGITFGEYEHHKLFLVMEYLQGMDLNSYISGRKLSFAQIINILIQVCDGMQAAHNLGIVHKDLKLENIFVLGKDGERIKIIDLGLAKSLRPEDASRITETGSCVGTPEYMAPEICLSQEYDHRADIYALGVMMYNLLTGTFPFEPPASGARAPTYILIQHTSKKPEPPSKRFRRNSPGIECMIPLEFDNIVMCALEKDPRNRFQSMAEFKAALLAAAAVLNIPLGSNQNEMTDFAVGTTPFPWKKQGRFGWLRSAPGVILATSAVLFLLSFASFFVFRPSQGISNSAQAEALQSAPEAQQTVPVNNNELVEQLPLSLSTPTTPQVVEPYIFSIKTDPPGALIELIEQKGDGLEWQRSLGKTPKSARLSREGLIRVSLPDYFPAYVELGPENRDFDLILKPLVSDSQGQPLNK